MTIDKVRRNLIRLEAVERYFEDYPCDKDVEEAYLGRLEDPLRGLIRYTRRQLKALEKGGEG